MMATSLFMRTAVISPLLRTPHIPVRATPQVMSAFTPQTPVHPAPQMRANLASTSNSPHRDPLSPIANPISPM